MQPLFLLGVLQAGTESRVTHAGRQCRMMGNIPREVCVAAVRPQPGCLAEPEPLQRVEGAEQGLPPGLACSCSSAGREGRWEAPSLLRRGPDADPLPALAHLGDEFPLLDIHKPLRAITDVGCSLLSVTLPCASVSCCHSEASQPG